MPAPRHILPSLPHLAAAAVCLSLTAGVAPAADSAPDPAAVQHFETHIRPLLAKRCFECHGADKQQGGVRLDRRATAFSTEELSTGAPAITAGDPAGSRLIEVLAHGDYDTGMPPSGKLPEEEIALLTDWVQRGAVWPEDAAPAEGEAADLTRHWSFQPVVRPAVPDAPGSTPIDRFLNAKMAVSGAVAAPEADRRTLVRRAYLDLLGLPPTWEELQTALADESPDWWPRLIDRLLADPRLGPRWARHWLDVARYADTRGYVFTESIEYAFAWTYRDYVSESFNEDKPFDQFVTEQLAADLLGLPENAPELAALGFLTLGDRFRNDGILIADDQVDVTSRGLLGLTVACARCHDHKFDPIPTEDYYALFGVFRSSVDREELPRIGEPADTPAVRAFLTKRGELEAAADAEQAKQTEAIVADLRAKFGQYLAAGAGVMPDDDPRRKALRDAAVRHFRDTLKRLKEDDAALGEWVRLQNQGADADPEAVAALIERFDAPQADAALAAADQYAVVPEGQFERFANQAERNAHRNAVKNLETFIADSPHAPPRAEALRDADRRVRNTVFIRGDRGRRGDEVVPHALPSILTDGELVELTEDPNSARGVSGRRELAAAIVDPENPLTARVIVNRVWAWHFGTGIVATPSDFGLQGDPPSHPELLDWLASEFVAHGWSLKWLHRQIALTDAYRRTAGPAAGSEIDPGNRLLTHFPRRRLTLEAWRDSVLAAAGVLDQDATGRPVEAFGPEPVAVRTIRARVNRNDLPGVLRNFDFPAPDSSAADRTETAVPQQALFALNGPHLSAWAASLAQQTGSDVGALYRRVLLREPTAAERERAEAYLAAGGERAPALLAQALLMSNEFAFLE
ncbi:PSD1 and planctomycete cytochrome C domain-containing protein [Alienimonas sp. DA493]|uniref:PSD1 and planctomycete cytochrome C domain-containing protein n=1 Tax=Alienimonas sp. DA493 TaxID=3373605 RepID=UPI003754A486